MACGGLRKRDGVLEQHNGFSRSTFNCVDTHYPETREIYKPYFQEAQYKGSIWVIHYVILLERELYFL